MDDLWWSCCSDTKKMYPGWPPTCSHGCNSWCILQSRTLMPSTKPSLKLGGRHRHTSNSWSTTTTACLRSLPSGCTADSGFMQQKRLSVAGDCIDWPEANQGSFWSLSWTGIPEIWCQHHPSFHLFSPHRVQASSHIMEKNSTASEQYSHLFLMLQTTVFIHAHRSSPHSLDIMSDLRRLRWEAIPGYALLQSNRSLYKPCVQRYLREIHIMA